MFGFFKKRPAVTGHEYLQDFTREERRLILEALQLRNISLEDSAAWGEEGRSVIFQKLLEEQQIVESARSALRGRH